MQVRTKNAKFIVIVIISSKAVRQTVTQQRLIEHGLTSAQYNIGYTADDFYRSKDPTNSIKVLKEKAAKENNPKKEKTQNTYAYITHTK